MRWLIIPALVLTVAACVTRAPPSSTDYAALRADVLLLGEQHDAAEHHAEQRAAIQSLVTAGRLAAVVLEMAERGHSTAGLAPPTSEGQVRTALNWNDKAWAWKDYAPAIMAAVQAGAPVLGANLSRQGMRAAMADETLDEVLPTPATRAQQEAIRAGHCGLLPESQIQPMTRVQVARDRSMAQVIGQAVSAGKTVVLLAGAGHVDTALGVPQHLPKNLQMKAVALPAQSPKADYCAQLREHMKPGAAR